MSYIDNGIFPKLVYDSFYINFKTNGSNTSFRILIIKDCFLLVLFIFLFVLKVRIKNKNTIP